MRAAVTVRLGESSAPSTSCWAQRRLGPTGAHAEGTKGEAGATSGGGAPGGPARGGLLLPSSLPRRPPCAPGTHMLAPAPFQRAAAAAAPGDGSPRPQNPLEQPQDARAGLSPSTCPAHLSVLRNAKPGASVCSSVKGDVGTSNEGVRHECAEHPTPCLAAEMCSAPTGY